MVDGEETHKRIKNCRCRLLLSILNQFVISCSWFSLLFLFLINVSVSLFLINVSVSGVCSLSLDGSDQYISAGGDSGMRRDGLRVAIESWNQCNEVGEEAPQMGSPKTVDCFDVQNKASSKQQNPNMLHHRATEEDNKLGVGKSFPGLANTAMFNVDLYAAGRTIFWIKMSS